VQIRGRVGEMSIPIVEALLDRTFEIHLMAVHCVAVERGGLIKKEKKFTGKT